MKISEVLLEWKPTDGMDDVPVASFGGTDITVGDVRKYIPSADPKTVIRYSKKINDILQTKPIDGVDYTVGNAIIDIGTALPLGRALKVAKTGIDVAKALGANELRRQIGHAAADQVEVLPTLGGIDSEQK